MNVNFIENVAEFMYEIFKNIKKKQNLKNENEK